MAYGRSAIISTRRIYIREAFRHFPSACSSRGFWRAVGGLVRELAGALS